MDCALVRNHLDAYVDSELEPSPLIELESHLHACTSCRDEAQSGRALKQAVQVLPRPVLPEHLRADIVRALDRAESAQRRAPVRGVTLVTGGLAVAAAALLAVVATQRPASPPIAEQQAAPLLVREVVARHVDQLPVDIGADRSEQIATWLSGKLGFRIRPVEFERADVRLVGARVTNLGGQPAARLDYTVGTSRLTVMVFQGAAEAQRLLHEDEAVERSGGRRVRVGAHMVTYHNARGYTVPMLEQDGLTYAFASDLGEQGVLSLIRSARLP